MINKKVSKETGEALHKGEEVSLMVKGEGWRYVSELFTQKILDLNNISKLKGSLSADDIKIEVLANQKAVKILLEIYNTIHTESLMHQKNLEAMYKEKKKDVLVNYHGAR